ncbi:MAG: hypothetical protein ACTSWA_00130 [Candidatus Thorarchaeota archaeon]
MNPALTDIPVLVHMKSGESETGILTYLKEGPTIELANGASLEEDSGYDGITFSVRDPTSNTTLQLTSEERVKLNPIYLGVKSFSRKPMHMDNMYPKSSKGWIRHIVSDGIKSVVTSQEIENQKKVVLIFSDLESGEILKAEKVNPYEIHLLSYPEDFTIHSKIVERDYEGDSRFISSILDGEPPTWNQIAGLVKDVNIPDLELKQTMRETVSQLVPKSFPEDIRDEVMAFLGWSTTAGILKHDPLYYSEKFLTIRIFRALLTGHLQCLLEDLDTPQYVRTMFMADLGMLVPPKAPMMLSAEHSPWLRAWYKLTENFPDSLTNIIGYANQLNEKGTIVTNLPVSKTDAKKSRRAWRDRYAMFVHGLSLRADVNNTGCGLKEVIYVGGAHKWPHKHLSWSARLGQADAHVKQFQVMVMPPEAYSIVVGTGSNIKGILWSARKTNLNLYDVKKRKWTMSIPRLHRSMSSSKTISQLRKEFTRFKPVSSRLSKRESEVLDLTSYGMYLHHLESGKYAEYLGLEKKQMKGIMDLLLKKNLIYPQYIPSIQGVSSIMIEAKGAPNKICSITRSFLKNTPSTNAFITDDEKTCYLITRLPEENAYDIVTQTPSIAEAIDVKLTCLPIRAYSGFRNNLYSRLWRDEGVWDPDLSGLLDQMTPR